MLRCVCCLSLRLSFIFSPIESDIFSPSTFHPIPLHPAAMAYLFDIKWWTKQRVGCMEEGVRPSAFHLFEMTACLYAQFACHLLRLFVLFPPFFFFSTPHSLNSLLAATEWAIWSYGNSKEKLVSHPKIAPCNSSLTNMRVYLSGQLHAERRVFIYLFFQSDY
jgi:hypothetical protein